MLDLIAQSADALMDMMEVGMPRSVKLAGESRGGIMASETRFVNGLKTLADAPSMSKQSHAGTASGHARLDIVLSDTRLGEVCVDVSVVITETQGAGTGALRGLERRERRKHLRYPGRGLYHIRLRCTWEMGS